MFEENIEAHINFESWQGFFKALQIPESQIPENPGDLMEVTEQVNVKPELELQRLQE